jgi:hypothetical protein
MNPPTGLFNRSAESVKHRKKVSLALHTTACAHLRRKEAIMAFPLLPGLYREGVP